MSRSRIFVLTLPATILMACILTLPGCRPAARGTQPELAADGRYDSEFPFMRTSGELRRIVDSVNIVTFSVFYKRFEFQRSDAIEESVDVTTDLLDRAKETSYFNQSVFGTATVLSIHYNRMLLLSSAHIFTKADTLFTHFERPDGSDTKYIASISIKVRDEITVPGLPHGGTVQILARDDKQDVAILQAESPSQLPPHFKTLDRKMGRAKDLEWGTFVYLIGFPKGRKLITRAIVSDPNRNRAGSFLLDASFNRGFSGGIVLAVRDGSPNFELVGMVVSAYAESEAILVPAGPAGGEKYEENSLYTGSVHVRNKMRINYGITRAVPAEAIVDLFRKNSQKLLALGFRVDF